MKKILIIGGGFAGSRAARKLERYKEFEIILIDTKNYFEFTPSVIKVISNPDYSKRIQILHKDYLKKTKIVLGEVTELRKDNAIVSLKKKKEKIYFDYCIICSGSNYSFPFKHQNIVLSSRLSNIENFCEKLLNSKKISIVGGGLVGVEIAGEFLDKFKDKEIIMIHKHKELMERNNKHSRDYAKEFLERNKVNIIFNEKVVNFKNKLLITDKGNKIKADLYFICTGITPNFEFLNKNFKEKLNNNNQIRVNLFMQVEGETNIFSAGDITDINEEKTAQNAERQAQLVVKNIINLERGKKLEKYKIKEIVLVISLGKYNGMTVYKDLLLKGIISVFLKKFIEVRHMTFIKLGINFHKI